MPDIWLDQINAYIQTHQITQNLRNAHKHIELIQNFIDEMLSEKPLRAHFSEEPSLMRATLFIKNTKNNWAVPWHQDKVVAVSDMFDDNEWLNWRQKHGVYFAEAPKKVLDHTLTLRYHLNDTDETNGAMICVKNSAHYGPLSQTDINQILHKSKPVLCNATAGDCWIMKPLTIHASNKSKSSADRSVLHIELSDYQLPEGIHWAG